MGPGNRGKCLNLGLELANIAYSGGKEIEVPCLDGRTLHFGAEKCHLGTGLGRRIKAEKPSSCHSPFGLDVAS